MKLAPRREPHPRARRRPQLLQATVQRLRFERHQLAAHSPAAVPVRAARGSPRPCSHTRSARRGNSVGAACCIRSSALKGPERIAPELVAPRRQDGGARARLLRRRGRERLALLALSRRPLWRRRDAALVPARRVRHEEVRMTRFAELAAATNFSFLRGASHAQEIVLQAKALGLAAIGIADRNTLAGVVRAHVAAKEAGIRMLRRRSPRYYRAASRSSPIRRTAPRTDACTRATDRWKHPRQERRMPHLVRRDPRSRGGQIFHRDAAARPDAAFRAKAEKLARIARGAPISPLVITIAAARPSVLPPWKSSPPTSAPHSSPPTTSSITMQSAAPSPTCSPAFAKSARLQMPDSASKPMPSDISRAAPRWPACSRVTRRPSPARRPSRKEIRFNLDELKYEYPDEPVPPGKTPQQHLTDLTYAYAQEKYPEGIPEKVATTSLWNNRHKAVIEKPENCTAYGS